MERWRRLAALLALSWTSAAAQPMDPGDDPAATLLPPRARDRGCLSCHQGIEEMHPWRALSCSDCHGGDGQSPIREAAHVAPRLGWPRDERVMQPSFDPPAVRFANPADLRVQEQTCGSCHRRLVEHLGRSLHGTTAGHLNDGLYENGINPTRRAVYSIFAVEDEDGPRDAHGLTSLAPIETLRVAPRTAARAGPLAEHFADLPRKACMQCHLWSRGFALPGRLGQDGLYRGAGCAACHVTYAEDGLSLSADPTVDALQPGHPLRHRMTAAPPTSTCTHCHVGDASIGNAFRGLAQLYPQMPAGPDIPGTTDRLIAGQFFIADERLTPDDVHHAAGMHCIDCHTRRDVMGDGDLYGAMEQAVEIECTSCHGTPRAYASLSSAKGRRLTHVERRGDLFILRSKVDGRVHRIPQVKDVLDPDHPDYRAAAAAAMNDEHSALECYACHAGWNTNFFGFHFDRNEQFTQLDLITGRSTLGAVSTQERVFATLRQFVLGVDPDGQLAPFMVGFSSMGTVHASDGSLLVDQGLPATSAGLSGMTMIQHQTHTVQRAARDCVECHRSPATWGLGTGGGTGGSFALARGLLLVVGERGLETLLLDRENPAASVYIARLPLGGARAVTLDAAAVDGRAQTAFVALESAGVALVDVSNPAFPTVLSFAAAGDVRDLLLAGDTLLIANGVGGLRVVDVADRRQPRLICDLATREARALDLQWPLVYVADGPGGLLVVDLSVPERPRVVGRSRVTASGDEREDDASDVATLFQYGRPQGHDERSPARMLAAVANGRQGLALLDVTLAEDIRRLASLSEAYSSGFSARAVTLAGRYELGDTTGLEPTIERDLAYVLLGQDEDRGRLVLIDVSDPERPALLEPPRAGVEAPGDLALVRSFNPPTLLQRLALAHGDGLLLLDVSDSDSPVVEANLTALGPLRDVAVEAFAFDRMIDESGRQLKDISHEGARLLRRDEIHRLLTVPGEVLGRGQQGVVGRERLARSPGAELRPGGSLAGSLPRVAEAESEEPGRSDAEERLRFGFILAPEEPLARLLRAADPRDFDGNGDGALGRAELERLVFSVLDANGDGRLDLLEWPRHPAADPRALDRDGDEIVSRGEMDLDEGVMRFLDVDGDGLVTRREWPWELLDEVPPVLLYSDVATLRRIISRPGFAQQHPGTYELIARGRSDPYGERGEVQPHDISDERLAELLAEARRRPLRDLSGQPALGGFLERWDLDGDGEVDAGEYAPLPRLLDRCDRNGDGRIGRQDVPRPPGR